MATALDIAAAFLQLARIGEEPTVVTQMQLQKLLYYAQGWSLGFRGQPLFAEPIEAWRHGPVVDAAYQQFKSFADKPIQLPTSSAPNALSESERLLVAWVWDRYGRYTGSYLRKLTHEEPPWRDAWGDRASDDRARVPIPHEAMAAHFDQRARRDAARIGLDLDQLARSLDEARLGNTALLDLSDPRRPPRPAGNPSAKKAG